MAVTCDTIFNGGVQLIQPKKGYRFGYDSLLLAYFTQEVKKKFKVSIKEALEIGGGCGIISLILVIKKVVERITTVEIQEEFVNIINKNVELNKVAGKIQVIHGDITNYNLGKEYDLVISNPPYIPIDNGRLSPDTMKAIAKQEVKLTAFTLADSFSRLLKPKVGIGIVIYPCFRMGEVISIFMERRLYPFYIRIIFPDPQTEGELFLMAFKNRFKSKLTVGLPLYIHVDRKLKVESVEMQKITSGEF